MCYSTRPVRALRRGGRESSWSGRGTLARGGRVEYGGATANATGTQSTFQAGARVAIQVGRGARGGHARGYDRGNTRRHTRRHTRAIKRGSGPGVPPACHPGIEPVRGARLVRSPLGYYVGEQLRIQDVICDVPPLLRDLQQHVLEFRTIRLKRLQRR